MSHGMHRIQFDDRDVRDLVLARVVWRIGETIPGELSRKQELFLGLFDLGQISWRSMKRMVNNATVCIVGYIVIILGKWYLYEHRHHIPD